MVSLVKKLWQCKAGDYQRGEFSKNMKLGRREGVISGLPCLVSFLVLITLMRNETYVLILFNLMTIIFRLT